MRTKFTALNGGLYRYLLAQRSRAGDPVLASLWRETSRLGSPSRMQISPEQGSFLTLLTAAMGARSALEVGTFTGYSSICIARGLGPRGRLLCLDASEEWTAIARRYWRRAGVEERIELRLAPAVSALEGLPRARRFDFAFIDADKMEYEEYYELVLPRVRRNGLILFDNMLWSGRVLKRGNAGGRAIDRLNRKLARDSRIECVLLPVADGIQICRKL